MRRLVPTIESSLAACTVQWWSRKLPEQRDRLMLTSIRYMAL
jgi:hypothetical protein